jgi:hypothetical protein
MDRSIDSVIIHYHKNFNKHQIILFHNLGNNGRIEIF